jgi:hypothetical protein
MGNISMSSFGEFAAFGVSGTARSGIRDAGGTGASCLATGKASLFSGVVLSMNFSSSSTSSQKKFSHSGEIWWT